MDGWMDGIEKCWYVMQMSLRGMSVSSNSGWFCIYNPIEKYEMMLVEINEEKDESQKRLIKKTRKHHMYINYIV